MRGEGFGQTFLSGLPEKSGMGDSYVDNVVRMSQSEFVAEYKLFSLALSLTFCV